MSFHHEQLDAAWRPYVHHLPVCTSTMDVAAQVVRQQSGALGGAGTLNLTTFVAYEQTAGRGRQGRSWATYPGHSLACTVVLRNGLFAQGATIATAENTPRTPPHLPLLISLAILNALRTLAPEGPLSIKWPNDILLAGRKLAGILIEPAATHTLVGIGLNLTRSPAMTEAFPGTTLADAHISCTREQLLNALFPCLNTVITLYASQGWMAFHHDYIQHCATIGQPVIWQRSPTEELRGIALGLHDSGALELRTETGTVHLIHSGDVIAQGRQHAA